MGPCHTKDSFLLSLVDLPIVPPSSKLECAVTLFAALGLGNFPVPTHSLGAYSYVYISRRCSIMRPFAYQRYRDSEMLQDAFIVLAPPILAFVGVLWFFWGH